eukprot:SAG11_NODE_43_length_20795_cov_11.860456_3_plen_1106_part_00
MTGPPGCGHPVETKCPSSIEFTVERLQCDRTWLSTVRLNNLSCSRRELRPHDVQSDANSVDLNIGVRTIQAFASAPLQELGLHHFVTQCSREEANLSPVPDLLPFNVDLHPHAKSHAATTMVRRLSEDVKHFAQVSNAMKENRLVKLLDEDLRGIICQPKGPGRTEAADVVRELIRGLGQQLEKDRMYVDAAIDHVLNIANCSAPGSKQIEHLIFMLGQQSREESIISFEMLVALLMCSSGSDDLMQLNPCLTRESAQLVQSMTAAIMLVVNRLALAIRCRDMAQSVLITLQNLEQNLATMDPDHVKREILLKSTTLASALVTKRQCFEDEAGKFYYEPRFLVFEFVHNIMLRKQQHGLVVKFIDSVAHGKSLCHQMIMGAGKTTVVGPLLALLLGDGTRLLMQVVPASLLEFSRSVMREKFSAVIRKSIYTFVFDRTTTVSRELLHKLLVAQKCRAVVTSTPTSVKSFIIKFVELLHVLDYENVRDKSIKKQAWSLAAFFGLKRPSLPREYTADDLRSMREECHTTVSILRLLYRGVLLLDEVDLILHPLKSELNWPLGDKTPLDLTMNSSGPGLRWQIPFVLLDAVLFCSTGRTTIELVDSRDAFKVLALIKSAIDVGFSSKLVQKTPHIVILDQNFYHSELRPLLSRWIIFWLKESKLRELSFDKAFEYITRTDVSGISSQIRDLCSDENFKILNLTREWLMSFMPFVLGKINRVSFGLLMPRDVERALKLHPKMPRSRKLLAVPFIGKDVPSEASEFSHPDVVIGLTILAYRYEGIRESDYRSIILNLQNEMQSETGPYRKRESWHTFAQWVALGGGRVRGVGVEQQRAYVRGYGESARVENIALPFECYTSDADRMLHNVPALQLIDVADREQTDFIFCMFQKVPHVIQHYLYSIIFPETMEFQESRLSANGQELGGDLIFGTRLGFSGTPSDLLPLELQPCNYEQGDDANMLHVLTSTEVVHAFSVEVSPWSVKTLLDAVARAEPPFNALIDTGALITGMTNYEVAKYLLLNGLPHIEGVVYLDENDCKMILLRTKMVTMKLSQCGISLDKRFVMVIVCLHMPPQNILNFCFTIAGFHFTTKCTQPVWTSSKNSVRSRL